MARKKKRPEPDSAAKLGLWLFSLAGFMSLVLGGAMIWSKESAVFFTAGDHTGKSLPTLYPVDGISMVILGVAILAIAAFALYHKRKGEAE